MGGCGEQPRLRGDRCWADTERKLLVRPERKAKIEKKHRGEIRGLKASEHQCSK